MIWNQPTWVSVSHKRWKWQSNDYLGTFVIQSTVSIFEKTITSIHHKVYFKTMSYGGGHLGFPIEWLLRNYRNAKSL